MPLLTPLRSGFPRLKGVRNVFDPYSESTEYLLDALNCYIPDTIQGAALYARPGFSLTAALLAGAGQAVYAHQALDGTTYNFIVAGGKLYRVDAAFTTFTDVTPAGSPISSSVKRVYFQSFGDYLIVNDETNRPWLASDLGNTPVTRTAIDFDGMGTAWTMFGRPTIYAGCLLFILKSVNGVGAQTDIAWSLPGDPTTGYQQPDYDFRWTLEQTGSSPLYGIWGTNTNVYYWRANSIGALVGTPGPDFQTTSTHDAVAANIGLLQSATIAEYNDIIYFCDQQGRPTKLPIGGKPVPIWLDMTNVIDNSTSAYVTNTAMIEAAVIEPNLNLYIAAIWSPTPGVAAAPVECQVFDAKTGAYLGRWQIGSGTSLEAIGILNNTAGSGRFVVVGSNDGPPTNSGYVWVQSAVEGGEGLDFLTTEDGDYLTTEDLDVLTTEDVIVTWKDNDVVPDIFANTPRLGYSDDTVLNVDQVTLITGNDSPVEITLKTPTTAGTVQGTPTPNTSEEGTFRLVAGADVQGRGVQVIASPTEADTQWIFQSAAVKGKQSKAGPEDP